MKGEICNKKYLDFGRLFMVKLVQINACYGERSTGKIVRDIDQLAIKNNIKSYVFCQEENKIYSNVNVIGNIFEWKSHAIFSRITAKQGFYSYFSTLSFLKKLDKIEPDIIHLHNLHANYVYLPLLLNYCAKKNIKTIVTLHDAWFFTGKCVHFLDVNCEKYKYGCNKCPINIVEGIYYYRDNSKFVWNKKRELFQNIYNLKVIGCSKWMADRAKECDVFKDKYVSYIYNGIDTNIFTKKQSNFREKYNLKDKFVILSFALKWFNEENKTVCENIIEYAKKNNSVIVLVGCNNKQIDKCKSINNILPLGFIRDENELVNVYNGCDVFVNLTLVDTFPSVNMESIACGTPVICYNDCGGGPELIKENITYVVPKFDYKEIIKSLDKIKNHSLDREDCIKYAKDNFDKEKNYMKYINLYLE